MSNSNTEINLEDYINSFSWGKRIVLLITQDKYSDLRKKTDEFFKTNICENKLRNLKYIRIAGDDIAKYDIPEKYRNKYGIWLIGYDGKKKSYSNDASLLKEIYTVIDEMPIRKSEIAENNKNCS